MSTRSQGNGYLFNQSFFPLQQLQIASCIRQALCRPFCVPIRGLYFHMLGVWALLLLCAACWLPVPLRVFKEVLTLASVFLLGFSFVVPFCLLGFENVHRGFFNSGQERVKLLPWSTWTNSLWDETRTSPWMHLMGSKHQRTFNPQNWAMLLAYWDRLSSALVRKSSLLPCLHMRFQPASKYSGKISQVTFLTAVTIESTTHCI